MNKPEEQIKVFQEGAESLVSEDELLAKLRRGRPLRIKYGCDPSRPDLHLGHVVQLDHLRALQDLGHTIIFLIGDFTARIGDPTGTSRTRPTLSKEDVRANAETYREQVSRVLDVDRAEIRFNAEWMDRMSLDDFVRLCARVTLARLMERDDFRGRYREGLPIALHELLYPMVQAYDSVALQADVEVGGSDQHVNLLLAREIQRAFGQEPQVALTFPLLEGVDGVEKMSKSVGNAIAITEPPDEMYGRTMSIPDEILPRWCDLLAQQDWAEVHRLRSGGANPRDLKAALARAITGRFWGEKDAIQAEERFDRLFRRHETPEEMPEIDVPSPGPEGSEVLDLLVRASFSSSRSEAKRLVAQGGVRLDGERVAGPDARVGPGEYVLQAGRRRFARIRVRPSVG
ncbi:MAG: tyrosine--tRNA ligase [Myxococcota bacterium]